MRTLEYLHALELPTPFPVGPISVYLADAPGEPLTLFDTGPLTDDTQQALEMALAQHGYQTRDLERIIVSHAHVDHFGLAGDLAAASGAGVMTHPWNVPTLAGSAWEREQRVAFYAHLLEQAGVPAAILGRVGQATRAMNHFARPVAVEAVVNEGDVLHLAGRAWRVLHTPGHAAGLICLYEPESRVLLSSDHLLADISSNPVVEPPPPGEEQRPRSLVLYQASLQRVAAMDIAGALPSHGPAIADVRGLVAERLALHRGRVERVADALRGGASTTWEVTEALFPGRSSLDTFLAVSEVIGHLDLLEVEGRIVAREAGGVIHWHLATGELAQFRDRSIVGT